MKVFFDRCISHRVAVASLQVAELLDHSGDWSTKRYSTDPGDAVWLTELGAEGEWVVITADKGIRKNPALKAVWRDSGLTAFFLDKPWMKIAVEQQVWRMAQWMPQVLKLSEQHKQGTGFVLPVNFRTTRLEQVYTPPAK